MRDSGNCSICRVGPSRVLVTLNCKAGSERWDFCRDSLVPPGSGSCRKALVRSARQNVAPPQPMGDPLFQLAQPRISPQPTIIHSRNPRPSTSSIEAIASQNGLPPIPARGPAAARRHCPPSRPLRRSPSIPELRHPGLRHSPGSYDQRARLRYSG